MLLSIVFLNADCSWCYRLKNDITFLISCLGLPFFSVCDCIISINANGKRIHELQREESLWFCLVIVPCCQETRWVFWSRSFICCLVNHNTVSYWVFFRMNIFSCWREAELWNLEFCLDFRFIDRSGPCIWEHKGNCSQTREFVSNEKFYFLLGRVFSSEISRFCQYTRAVVRMWKPFKFC